MSTMTDIFLMVICIFIMWQNIFAYRDLTRIEEKLDRLLAEREKKE